jgi:hypothetical protein
MSKSISRATGGPSVRVTTVMVALAVVLLLVLAVVAIAKTTSTNSDSAASPAKHAISSDIGTGGISVNQQPYSDRHADVIARYHADSLRQSQRR